MGFLILILVTVLPSYLLGRYIYKKDPEKKPKKLLRKIMWIGVLFTFVAAILETIFNTIWSSSSFITYLIQYVIGVAFIEEVCKFLPAYWIGIRNKTIKHRYDVMVYIAFATIGFATFENILYVFTSGGMNTAVYRMIFAVPGHVIYGILMGYFLGIAYQEKQNGNKKSYHTNMIYSFLIPTLFHGLYDFSLIYGVTRSNALIVFSPYIIEIVLFFYAIGKVKKVASNKDITEEEKKKKSGRNLIIVWCILIVLLMLLSVINPIRLRDGGYNIKENVKIKEDGIILVVESFEEDKITNQLTLNLKIKNSSNQIITIGTSQFSFANMMNTKDIRGISRFETNNQSLLYIQPNETVTTKIKFRNVVSSGENNYLLAYTSKADKTKSYVIFIGKDFAQALRNMKQQ